MVDCVIFASEKQLATQHGPHPRHNLHPGSFLTVSYPYTPWSAAQPPVTSVFVLSKLSSRVPPAAHPFFHPIDAVLGQHVQSEPKSRRFSAARTGGL